MPQLQLYLVYLCVVGVLNLLCYFSNTAPTTTLNSSGGFYFRSVYLA